MYDISELGYDKLINKAQFKIEHQKNFIDSPAHLVDAGVIIKEVLWNGKPQQPRDVTTDKE